MKNPPDPFIARFDVFPVPECARLLAHASILAGTVGEGAEGLFSSYPGEARLVVLKHVAPSGFKSGKLRNPLEIWVSVGKSAINGVCFIAMFDETGAYQFFDMNNISGIFVVRLRTFHCHVKLPEGIPISLAAPEATLMWWRPQAASLQRDLRSPCTVCPRCDEGGDFDGGTEEKHMYYIM